MSLPLTPEILNDFNFEGWLSRKYLRESMWEKENHKVLISQVVSNHLFSASLTVSFILLFLVWKSIRCSAKIQVTISVSFSESLKVVPDILFLNCILINKKEVRHPFTLCRCQNRNQTVLLHLLQPNKPNNKNEHISHPCLRPLVILAVISCVESIYSLCGGSYQV